MHLGWIEWTFGNAHDGDYTIPFTLTGVNGAESSVDTAYTRIPTNPVPNLIPEAVIDAADELNWYFALQNPADAPAKLLYENTCIVELHIISPSGEIVYDTRDTQWSEEAPTIHTR